MDKEKHHTCISMDELLVQAKSNIDQYGWHVIIVEGTDYLPSYTYTIGLFETFGQPEIICFGLPGDLGHRIINDVVELIKDGANFKTYTRYDNICKNCSNLFLPIDKRNMADYFGVALNYYNTEFPAVQLVWPDSNNTFPWEAGFAEEYRHDQPLLDRNADFKFREAKNLGIFTTRQWLELGSPILRVVHDADGDWQFLTGDQMPDDFRLVALAQIVLRDNTLNEVFDLDYGYSMERDFIGGEWTKAKVEESEEEA